jgi:hypothetical protein
MIIKINVDIDYILESIVLLLITQEEVLAHPQCVLYTLLSIMT